MGGSLGCRTCHQCRNCSTCHDRCSSVCLGDKNMKPVVPSHGVASGVSSMPLETENQLQHYPVPGLDCSSKQRVCGDFDEQDPFKAIDLSCSLDRILPLPPQQTSDIPNIGQRKSIDTLKDECRFNAGKVQKVQHLSRSYTHWRPIRGDGNCYYRTVVFGALESLLAVGDHKRLGHVDQAFRQVYYDDPVEQNAHEHLLRYLSSWDNLKELERWIAVDCALDEALIRACRRLVRLFLVARAHATSPNGLTYSELALALDSAYTSMEEFCAQVVDPMGRDAETLALDALPMQLGVGVRLLILDRRDEVDLVSLDTPGPDGTVDVHVLFKPGHYDLLYPRVV